MVLATTERLRVVNRKLFEQRVSEQEIIVKAMTASGKQLGKRLC